MKIFAVIITCSICACIGVLLMACAKSGGYADKMREYFNLGYRKGYKDGKEE